MSNAVIYIRVSTEEQARGGVSLAAQEAAAYAYCAMRSLEVVELVTDAGVSAGKPLADRAGGRRVLELVDTGAVVAVVALKLDRLFRDCADCLDVTRIWEGAGAALHLVDLGGQAIDTSSAMGRFFLTVMAGAAELERNLVSERTRAAMAHKKAQGQRVGAVPYGYALADDGQTLVELPSEQAVITEARRLVDAGLSLRKVAAELARLGFKPRKGASWYAQQVKRMVA